MGDFHWSELSEVQQFFAALLITSAAGSVLTVVLLVVKILMEYYTLKKSSELVRVAHDLLRVDAEIRRDVLARTAKVEAHVERAAETAREVKEAAEVVKTVVSTADPGHTPPLGLRPPGGAQAVAAALAALLFAGSAALGRATHTPPVAPAAADPR